MKSSAEGSGAYNRYFGLLDTGKMNIRGVMARKGDTPEYVCRMQKELFDVLAEARSQEELPRMEPKALGVRRSTGTSWGRRTSGTQPFTAG